MPLTASSLLHGWSSRFGAMPIIGGNPRHTRASTAKWVDQMGVVREAPVNTPRFEWATISGERRPVMRLEQAGTNLLSRASEFDHAAWLKDGSGTNGTNGATVTANVAIAPDGTLTADRFTQNAGTLGHWAQLSQQVTQPVAGAQVRYAGSIWMRTESGGNLAVDLRISDVSFGTQTQVVTVTPAWQRFTFVSSSVWNASGTLIGLGVGGVPVGQSILVWGGKLARADAVSSFVHTDAASATRATDSFYWDYLHAPQAMMAYVRFIPRLIAPDLGHRVLNIGTGASGAQSFLIYNDPYVVYFHNGTTSTAVVLPASPSVGDVVELIAVLNPSGSVEILQSINGAAITGAGPSASIAYPAAWSGSRVYINSIDTSAPGLKDYAELKIVKYADVVAGTSQGRMDELRAFELAPSGEVI